MRKGSCYKVIHFIYTIFSLGLLFFGWSLELGQSSSMRSALRIVRRAAQIFTFQILFELNVNEYAVTLQYHLEFIFFTEHINIHTVLSAHCSPLSDTYSHQRTVRVHRTYIHTMICSFFTYLLCMLCFQIISVWHFLFLFYYFICRRQVRFHRRIILSVPNAATYQYRVHGTAAHTRYWNWTTK